MAGGECSRCGRLKLKGIWLKETDKSKDFFICDDCKKAWYKEQEEKKNETV